MTSDFKLGVSAGSYFGLGLDYDGDWAGRYYVQEGKFLTFGVNPVAAYRINKYLSAGAGVSMVVVNYEVKTALRNLEPGSSDGRLKFNDYDTGFGGNAGLMIEPKEGTRFGVTYRSKVDLEYKDKPDLNNVGPLLQGALNATGLAGAKVKLDMELPQAVMASAYHEFTDKLAIMGNVGWQNWSSFGNIDVYIDSTPHQRAPLKTWDMKTRGISPSGSSIGLPSPGCFPPVLPMTRLRPIAAKNVRPPYLWTVKFVWERVCNTN
jgi:long-chain fatty acid transport protein